ncbi:uncharacterized protein DUF4189 [Luteibacter rhizovicinus]|uniref:Uncharacterized protein DUF4189 n=1 Tax=Luteibacter rhizovicinus TaxID=242606 RepID=A0A4R3YX03_9GAMM|nr:DUF4189 domain-containing protein [Luteibacter rhizovicinus]TCV97221.1 uncharacterized protein DUF4189 [Luteibacter rhizovicinus]
MQQVLRLRKKQRSARSTDAQEARLAKSSTANAALQNEFNDSRTKTNGSKYVMVNMQRIAIPSLCALSLALFALAPAHAQEATTTHGDESHASKSAVPQDAPAEVRELVPADSKLIFYKATGSTDGSDAVAVMERQKKNASDPDITSGQRPLLVLRKIDGVFKEVARNDRVIACSVCGATFEDPFDRELTTLTPGHIHIEHNYGGRQVSSFIYNFSYNAATKQWRVTDAVSTWFDNLGEGAKHVDKVPLPTSGLLADFDPRWRAPVFWNALVVNDQAQTFSMIIGERDPVSLEKSMQESCQSSGNCRVLFKQANGCLALAKDSSGVFYAASSQKKKALKEVASEALNECNEGGKGSCKVIRHDCSWGW